jgi:hypothetical protein
MIETGCIVKSLVGKEVVVQLSSLTPANFRVRGRLLGYSFNWAEPELLVLEEEDGSRIVLRSWSVIAIEGGEKT